MGSLTSVGCEPFPSRTSRLGASLFQGVRLRSRLTAIRVVAPATTEATIIVVRWETIPPLGFMAKDRIYAIATSAPSQNLQLWDVAGSAAPTLKARRCRPAVRVLRPRRSHAPRRHPHNPDNARRFDYSVRLLSSITRFDYSVRLLGSINRFDYSV